MYYRRVGDVPRKRHIVHCVDGARTNEELMGEEGFSSASALLYHRHSPSAVTEIEALAHEEPVFTPNLPLAAQHLRPRELPAGHGDAVTGRYYLLGNDNVRLAWVTSAVTSPLYRNAVGDELLYVQTGSLTIESVFGRLDAKPGDYVVIPCSTTYRVVVHDAIEVLVIEARGHVQIPQRYLNRAGQMVEGAPFSERDVRGPGDEPLLVDGESVPVLVRSRTGISRHVHVHHPFDVVGWDGSLYPWAFSIHDFEPIVGRIHQPPPVHQTFAGPGFVVCSFVPRLYDFDPDAVKVPYHHANVDSDEVLFYSDGDFMSRAGSGIGQASISLHPAGFVHGPQPGSHERSIDVDRTGELAVMLDTFAPLGLTAMARGTRDPAYPFSWSRGGQ